MTKHFNNNLKIAFISFSDSTSCKMAKGLFKDIAETEYEIYSAVIDYDASINSNAISVMNELNIDISNQQLDTVKSIPEEVDILIAINYIGDLPDCVSYHHKENWNINTPKYESIDEFRKVRDEIKEKCTTLYQKLRGGQKDIAESKPNNRGPKIMTHREYDDMITRINEEADNLLAIVSAILLGLLCSVTWALVSYITEEKLGILSILVGVIVSQGFTFAGKSTKFIMGITASIITFMSILLGNILIVYMLIADSLDIGFIEVVRTFHDSDYFFKLLKLVHSKFDIIFYLFSMFIAFKNSYINKKSLSVSTIPYKRNDMDNTKE